ncbi:cytochrome C biogenesis protein CcsB [Enterovibrio norvegicus FF-33]|uniref:Cytochrome C biogenesis protein CcsB n=1 Tax=Enterovibrio norvegicus FF-454 TaxID=1185651 RepID=A0A1E5BZH4_9GAMM|nr:c-type cytochrome [Enterovibrio norvegicus]OEE58655.1 cytochrome C biogenesis protein CcsB [Enterovibrio norvegicus FF-454]OEE68279.1 cytochrome C biogenesis protein CcsB [Enterovibrio norvegicus FF-33]OEE74307.1 cytochrome C biogenesis protein CcsB [Enterovibrio norvegicus FF-162]
MKKLLPLGLVTLMLATPSFAAGDAAAGKAKAAVCAACHGANGIAMIPGYPNLAGQNAQYIVSALKAYKSGERKGGQSMVMAPQATMLSDADMENLAAYFSQMK